MKRTLALTLTVLMVLTMIPASLLNVLARGPGVAANVTTNQTIPNADGQFIPETVVVDGVVEDTAWYNDDWNEVSSDTGSWSVQYPSDANVAYSYRYQLKADYYFLYGVVELSSTPAGLVTIYLNDGSATGRYTDIFTFDVSAKTFVRTQADGTAITDTSAYYYEQSKFEIVTADDGSIVIEFKSLLADFCPKKNPDLTYFVAVECENGEKLFHPMLEINESYDRNACFPSLTKWPSEFAAKIEVDDLQGYSTDGDTVVPSININGEFDESFWAQHTDFYSKWYERTNLVSYKNGLKEYADLDYNKLYYAGYIGGEHDVRVMLSSIEGAALILDQYHGSSGTYQDTVISYDMYQVYSEGNYDQLVVTLRKDFSDSTYTKAAATFYAYRDAALSWSMDVSSDITWGCLPTGSPGMYAFEFSIPRGTGTNLANYAPTYYDFSACSYPDSSSDFVDGYCSYGSGNYPITHYRSEVGGEYYNPANATYSAEGFLGVRAWPGLLFAADSDFNSNLINVFQEDGTTRISNRIVGMNYLHSLVTDYEFIYGAIDVCKYGTTSTFEEWKHGNATDPGTGDFISVYLSPDEGTTIYRYDVWTYKDGDTVSAVIGFRSGSGVYYINQKVKAAYVHRADNVWAFEYRIPLSSIVADGLLYSQSVADNSDSNVSPEILQYYVSLNVSADTEGYEDQHINMLWPRSDNTVLPQDDGFTWNTAYDTENYDTAEVLKYEDVIRAIEPDGKIIEEQRTHLDSFDYSNAEYRDISTSGNVLSGHKKLYVGKDYVYLCARFNGDLVASTTRVILWLKNNAGTITKYEWYNTGSSNQMVINGTNGYVAETLFGFSTANGATSFEAVVPVDSFGGDDGFEYFIELQQSVNGEVLNRVYPKIELPEITGYADYFNLEDSDWTNNAGTVGTLIHFDPEKIAIDGYLNDNGWDPEDWIYVSTDINASVQETQTHLQLMKSDFYYQLRVDDEYLYVGAVILYHDAGYYSTWEYDDNGDPLWVTIPATYENIYKQEPNFRLWLKTGSNGSSFTDTNTYTSYYDIRLKDDATTTDVVEDNITYQNYFNTFPSYANNTRDLFNKNYDYVNPDDNKNGIYEPGEGADWSVVDSSNAFHTFIAKGYGDSVLWGYTKQYINENEAVLVNDEGQTRGERINPEDYEAEGMLDHEEEGVESGVMVSGAEKSLYYKDSQMLLGENTLVVEFKVELEEFGGTDQFQYYVHTGTHASSWGGSRVTMYPAIPSEVDSGNNYFHYYYPYWFWKDGESVTVTEALREDMTLRTYKKPVITLGAKVSETYNYYNKEVNAIRFGGLWTEEYIRKVNGLKETDGYQDGNYTDYWDVEAMGMVIMPTYLVQENTREDRYNEYSSHAGRYELFQDTKGAAWMDADGIVSWVGGTTSYPDTHVNFADYTNFAFYVTVVNCPTNMPFCFRGFVNYYDDCNNAYSYHDVILERSFNMVVDQASNSQYNGAWEEHVALKPGQFTDETYKPGTSVNTDNNLVNPDSGTTDDPIYEGITAAPAADQKTIAYVPLDNRPVNVDRVEYVAGASGFTLRMPDEADYVTVMDTNVTAGNGIYAHGGNPENVLKWLKSQELAGVDYYVLSLDQLFSGGLCESRLDGTISELDYEIADYIITLSKDSNNHVVLGDTLMRLAPETDYKDYTAAQYNVLRAYGMQERLVLADDDLTLANVIANYKTGADGNELSTTVTHWTINTDNHTDTVDADDLNTHLAARARKLTLIDYVIRNAGTSIDKLFIAVDDSSSSNNIQVNDRNYIAKTAGELGVSYKMFAGADELGMLGVAETASYKYTRNDVPVNVVYFGDGQTINPADAYDYATLETSIDNHLAALGATDTDKVDANTLQILVLTRAQKVEQYVTNPDAPPHEQITATITSEDTDTVKANAALLAAQLKANLEAGIPTCIIDGSNAGAGNSRILSEALLSTAWGDEGYNLGEVLSYSCWNTIGNTVGIGLSNAIGRFTYIYNNDPTSASNEAFVKGLTFSLVKDQAYRAHTSGNGGGNDGVYLVGYNNFEFDYDAYDSVNSILAKLNTNKTILGKDGRKVEFGTVSVSGVEWTWDREFECRFDISVEALEDPDTPADPDSLEISSINVSTTGTASEGNPLFYATLDKINGLSSLVGVANSGFSMQWYLDDDTPLYPSSSTFAAETEYDLFIKVTRADGYTFADTVTVTLTTADGTYTGVIDTNYTTEDVLAFDFIVTGLDDPNLTTFTVDNVNGVQESDGSVFYYVDTTSLWTADEYTNSNGEPTWSVKALLEWDDNTNTYKVIATEASGGTTYLSWDYGIDRVILSSNDASGTNTTEANIVANLQIGQRLTMGNTLAEIKAMTAGYNEVTVNVLSVVEETINVPNVDSIKIADLLPDSTSQKVAYVPLDNRPVHTDRVEYLAAASGITLSMPTEADYTTTLATDGTQSGGNPANILTWLKAQEAAGVDYYVIALDQVFSGGLVASREANGVAENGALSEHDLEAIAFLTELARNNYVVYTDTVIRLAMTTSGYGSYSDTLYNAMRNYGIAAREKLGEDGNRALTLDNVISSYRYNDTGVEAVDYGSLTEDQIDGMLDARERKLRVIDALIKSAGGNINRLIVGLDDANATNHNLQSNELAYIKQIATTCGANLYTIAGADEMGLMGLAAVANNQFAADPIKVQFITYGVADAAADGYDYGTLTDSLQYHLAAIGGVEVTEDADIQILVLGRGASALELASTTAASTYAEQLVTKLLANLEANIPTAVIDASNHYGGHANILIGAMIDGGVFTDRTDATEILGYSQWNTVGNAVGISMSNAIARYAYLTSGVEVTTESNAAFMKAYVFSMVKDNVYRANAIDGWTLSTASNLPNGTITAYGMLNYIHNSTNILGKDCASVAYDKVATVWVGETITQTWGRPFEVSFIIGGLDE